MSVRRPRPGPHRVHTAHRVGAVLVGAGLALFGCLGLLRMVVVSSATQTTTFGLSCNELLAVLSVLVGMILVVAGLRSGPTASTVSMVIGALFLVNGVGHLLVLDNRYDPFEFRLPNILFSLAVGLVLVPLGAYGRLSVALPPDNPYAEPTTPSTPRPALAGRERVR